MNPDLEGDERIYFEIPNIQMFSDVVDLCLDEYNQTHKTRMNLVIFRYINCLYTYFTSILAILYYLLRASVVYSY